MYLVDRIIGRVVMLNRYFRWKNYCSNWLNSSVTNFMISKFIITTFMSNKRYATKFISDIFHKSQNLYGTFLYIAKFIRNEIYTYRIDNTKFIISQFLRNKVTVIINLSIPSILYVQVNGPHLSRLVPIFFQYGCKIYEKLNKN